MPEDYYTSQPAVRPHTGPSLRAMLLAGLISFLAGAGLIGWLVWHGQIDLGRAQTAAPVMAGQPAPLAATPNPAATLAATALEQQVSAPVLTLSLYERFRSRTADGFGDRLLSAMRFKFGGHVAPKP